MEIKQSQFNDPEATSGQHTNGPANTFVRDNEDCPWYVVCEPMSMAKAKKIIEEIGIIQFQVLYCIRV